MYSPEEFREKIETVLKQMDMHSKSACDLLLGTALHESMGLKYRRQLNGGPALSYFQIEPDTLFDLYDNYLEYRDDKKELLNSFMDKTMPITWNLEHNDDYAIAAARLQYYRKPEKIPRSVKKQAEYWKEHWNTEKGKGTVEKYLNDWNEYYAD